MARPVEPEPLEGPVRFGPYTLVRRIGAGGMGEVFLAREESQRRACVVKKVLPQLMEDPRFVGRFRDEARVVVRLDHPNIARVYAMGEVEGQLYLAMEYVQGKTLSRLAYRLRQLGRTIPLGPLLHLGQRLCEGLAYAHDAKDADGHPLHLVHRDLSPANVCLSYAGEVKVIDFGAAQSTLKEQQTAPRVVIGNLTYMAPEQARKRFVDRRADVYAVGALLWELVAWRPLAQRGDPVERWRRAAYPTWEPAGRFRQGVPTSVDAFLLRALAGEPDQRFPDAGAMAAELARLKAKLAPGTGDAHVARLMESAFPREKVSEENALRELLSEDTSRKRTEQELAAVLTPPTALAFEHGGIDAPEDFVPAASPAPEAPREGTGQGAGRRGATALYGTAAVGTTDSAATEALPSSKVLAAARGADSAVTEALTSSKVLAAARGADASATEALESSMVLAAARGAGASATEALEASKVTEALEASKVQARARGADTAATEALESSKVLGAIARAEASRASGPKDASLFPGTEDTVTPVMAQRSTTAKPAPARRATRETRVGFGVDISQSVDSAEVEARRLELVRAITGEDEATTVEPNPPRARKPGRRALLAVGLFVSACALGLGVAWALAAP
ncbi:serine/threonine-protein kinase [Pyxidicoccus xibeiensis]|uniref:serine/threonine-protein kinase n=1 Tax=Pyxidicoccus xibeiensis TaxID=2906759 RepID=UPI0020A827C0|nr:serine/threonine-protein kinase [Pyxidicoccus xibeiensis]MCP3136501.1 serine/threonine protein kinase [Pyxidicoccus xibeiensis]